MYHFNDSIIMESVRKNEILLEQVSERSNLEHQNLKLLINKEDSLSKPEGLDLD